MKLNKQTETIYEFLETENETIYNIDNLEVGSMYLVRLSDGIDDDFDVFEAKENKISMTVLKDRSETPHNVEFVELFKLHKQEGKCFFEKEYIGISD